MLPSTSSGEVLLACPSLPPWNLPSFVVESALSFPCSRSGPPFSHKAAALAILDSLLPVIWCSGWTNQLLFLMTGGLRRSCRLLSLWKWDHSFLFGRLSVLRFYGWGLHHSARSLLVSAGPAGLPFLFSSASVWLSFRPHRPVLSSIFPLVSDSETNLAGAVVRCLIKVL